MIYDVLLSYARADRDRVLPLLGALRERGLRVLFDESDINEFAGITDAVQNALADSRVLVAFYTRAYPTRRACQCELTTAYLTAQQVGDALSRILVVNPEPDRTHIQPVHLRDERMTGPSDDPSQYPVWIARTAELIVRHLSTVGGALGPLAASGTPMWLPRARPRARVFVGRLPLMWQIHSALHPERQRMTADRDSSPIAVVHGMAGAGKTLLVQEYAERFAGGYPGGVFWLDGGVGEDGRPGMDHHNSVERQLQGIAEALGLGGAGSPGRLRAAISQWIADRGKPCLWIVDGLPETLDLDQFGDWCAPHPLARTLMTSRTYRYSRVATPVEAGVLGTQEAMLLLTCERAPQGEAELRAAEAIVAELGGHAMAIDQVGVDIARRPLTSFAALLEELRETRQDKLDEASADAHDAIMLPTRQQTLIGNVMQQSIASRSRDTVSLLGFAAMLAAEPIPGELAVEFFRQEGSRTSPERALSRAEAALAGGIEVRLVQPTSEGQLHTASGVEDSFDWSVHPLVTRTMQFHVLGKGERAELVVRALKALAAVAPSGGVHAYNGLTRWRRMVAHANHVLELPSAEDADPAAAWLLDRLAVYLHARVKGEGEKTRTRLDEAERLLNRAVAKAKHWYGANNPALAPFLSHLAVLVTDLGRPEEARPLAQLACELVSAVRPAKTADGAEANHALGYVLINMDKTTEAELYLRRAMELSGAATDELVPLLVDLAQAECRVGDYHEAQALLERAQALAQASLGDRHPENAVIVACRAYLAWLQRDAAAALSLLKEALAAVERLYDPDDPLVATANFNLAVVLDEQGKFGEAEKRARKAFDIRMQTLGQGHPNTHQAIKLLAQVLRRRGKNSEAEELEDYHRSLHNES